MSGQPLRPALVDYLAVRRSLGFKLARDGLLLQQFVAYCEQRGAGRVTSEVALAWVTTPVNASPSWLAMRLSVVRGFTSWLQAGDRPPRCRRFGGYRHATGPTHTCTQTTTSRHCWRWPGGRGGRCRRPPTKL